MVVVGLFGQGLATCGVSLIRLAFGPCDVALGLASVIASIGLTAFAAYATTAGLDARMVKVAKPSGRRGWADKFLAYSTWPRR